MADKAYEVQWRYASSYGGPFQPGERVQLDEAQAESINRDSPGVLVEIQKAKPKPKEEPKTESKAALDEAPKNRQIKKVPKPKPIRKPAPKKKTNE